MAVKQGASTVITSMKLGTTAITKVKRGGLNVWPTTDNITVAWGGTTTFAHNIVDSSYWGYDALRIRLVDNGSWVVEYLNSGIGGGGWTTVDSGTWGTPITAGVGVSYEAKFTTTTAAAGDWSLSGVSLSTWVAITATTFAAFKTNTTYPVPWLSHGTVRVEVRAVGLPTVLLTTLIDLTLNP